VVRARLYKTLLSLNEDFASLLPVVRLRFITIEVRADRASARQKEYLRRRLAFIPSLKLVVDGNTGRRNTGFGHSLRERLLNGKTIEMS
jgi:hypothetical protein